ncbi:MAG: hypothetical protein C0594_03020 [Marinilabiliales bacterium]|nr:MAG: hypothetical protein C0594_03020 [Marinilabiliales bacterium]
MEIIIRDYNQTDYNSLSQKWEEAGVGGAHRGDTRGVINRTLKNNGKLYLLEFQGEIIGSSWLTNDGRRIYLHHFFIQENYRRQGLAKRLLHESVKYADQCGMQIKLEVHAQNTAAENLYRNFGFQELGDYNVFIIRDFSKIQWSN